MCVYISTECTESTNTYTHPRTPSQMGLQGRWNENKKKSFQSSPALNKLRIGQGSRALNKLCIGQGSPALNKLPLEQAL